MSEDDKEKRGKHGKLSIPLPFEDPLKAATKVPADKLPPPSKQKPRRKRPAKS